MPAPVGDGRGGGCGLSMNVLFRYVSIGCSESASPLFCLCDSMMECRLALSRARHIGWTGQTRRHFTNMSMKAT